MSIVLQTTPQSQKFGRGLGHIHVNGVQLLNGGQGQRLMRSHQSPIRHIGFSDPAGDGRRDAGIFQIDSGRLHRGFPNLNISLGLLQSGLSIVIVLLTDRFFRVVIPCIVQTLAV